MLPTRTLKKSSMRGAAAQAIQALQVETGGDDDRD